MEWYAEESEVVSYSLQQIGNTARLHRALQKARSGQTMTVAYLGGSITAIEQAPELCTTSYPVLLTRWLEQEYGAVRAVHAGLPGTCAAVGLLHAETVVLPERPDITIVEFALNGNPTPMNIACFAQILDVLAEQEGAVIPFFCSMITGSSIHSGQTYYTPAVMEHDFPLISPGQAIAAAVAKGSMEWGAYSHDNMHPNDIGQVFLCHCLMHYLREADRHPEEAAVPFVPGATPHLLFDQRNCREDASLPEPMLSFSAGDFQPVRTREPLPFGWELSPDAAGEPLVCRLRCRRLLLVYETNADPGYAAAEVWVDGQFVTVLEGYWATSWGNPQAELVLDQQEPGVHTFELRRMEGDAGKRFILQGFEIF